MDLVIYYSKSGNNKYLAEKLSKDLSCDLEAIVPRSNIIVFQVLSTFTRLSPGIKKLSKDLREYNRVIIVSPTWIGKVIYPVYSFLKKYLKDIKELHYLSCNGCPDDEKDGKFGSESVFRQLRDIVGSKLKSTNSFPIQLTLPEDKRGDDEAVMAARLTDVTFNEEIQERYGSFLNLLKA